MKKYKACEVFIIVICLFDVVCLFAASDDTKEQICFFSSENRIMTLELEEPDPTDLSKGAILKVYSKETELLNINLGMLRFYLTPYITKLKGINSQLVFVPYLRGSGSGYGYYEWCVVTAESNKAQYHDLGLLGYHSVSRYSHIFEISPSFTGSGFNFRMSINEEKTNEVIEGNLKLKVIKGEEFVTFQLVPEHKRDALACLQLCKNKINSIAEWAEDRLETIAPDAVKNYRISRKGADLELLKKSIISYYDNHD